MMSKYRMISPFVVFFLCLDLVTLVLSQEMVPPVLEGNILIKVLSYEKNLKQRSGPLLNIGFLYNPKEPLAEKHKTEIQTVFDKVLSNKSIQGMTSELIEIPFLSSADLRTTITSKSIDILYLCPDFDDKVPSILELCKEFKIITITGNGHYVEAGATVGVVLKEGKPEILVNLKAANDLRLDFDLQLLKLATVLQ
ncbi:DUF4154 domain-containing protein [bacterium]|nr:DUF4154 domain-containing protein [bacterium]